MAEVIPASGDDWREIERRASLPEGHVERALLEILQRLVPVENQVVPVGAAGADHVPDAGKLPTAMEINQEWLATYREDGCSARYDLVAFAHAILAKWGNRPTPTAAPAGGVTEVELAEVMYGCKRLREVGSERVFDGARYLFNHRRIGPLLRSEGAPAPKRVVLQDWPPKVSTPLYWNSFSSLHGQAWQEGHTAGWAAARAEVERQQGGQADG